MSKKFTDDYVDLSNKVDKLDNLMKVGFIILVVMVATIIVSAVLFEIQTINKTNQQNTMLLQAIGAKVK
jgi:hypothetical protein